MIKELDFENTSSEKSVYIWITKQFTQTDTDRIKEALARNSIANATATVYFENVDTIEANNDFFVYMKTMTLPFLELEVHNDEKNAKLQLNLPSYSAIRRLDIANLDCNMLDQEWPSLENLTITNCTIKNLNLSKTKLEYFSCDQSILATKINSNPSVINEWCHITMLDEESTSNFGKSSLTFDNLDISNLKINFEDFDLKHCKHLSLLELEFSKLPLRLNGLNLIKLEIDKCKINSNNVLELYPAIESISIKDTKIDLSRIPSHELMNKMERPILIKFEQTFKNDFCVEFDKGKVEDESGNMDELALKHICPMDSDPKIDSVTMEELRFYDTTIILNNDSTGNATIAHCFQTDPLYLYLSTKTKVNLYCKEGLTVFRSYFIKDYYQNLINYDTVQGLRHQQIFALQKSKKQFYEDRTCETEVSTYFLRPLKNKEIADLINKKIRKEIAIKIRQQNQNPKKRKRKSQDNSHSLD